MRMRKLLLVFAMGAAISAYSREPEQKSCTDCVCCNQCDSINMPVYIVDGVEIQDISGIASDDIVKVDVIKDSAITKIFSPRLGGVLLITTKSKKFLTPILENYNKLLEEQKQQRIPGQLRIR